MNARTLISACCRTVIAGGFALALLPLPGAAADNAPPETLYVKVFPDHYVAAGKPFADLAALEAWARPILIRSVWLDFCYPASAKEIVSAVERVRATYSSDMQIRMLSAGQERCASEAEHTSSSSTSAHEQLVRRR